MDLLRLSEIRILLRTAFIFLLAATVIPVARADLLLELATRPGVTQAVLVWEPQPARPETVILLIPGGPGDIGLGLTAGQAVAGHPYLYSNQRQALLAAGFAVAVLDAPSDQKNMTQEYRVSRNHATDLNAVITEIRRRFPYSRLVLVAHSRGTLSAGYLLQNMADQIHAAVLLSGLYQVSPPGVALPSSGPGLSKVKWAELKTPVLLVHHRNDACPVAPYSAALTSKMPMISVSGPADVAESPCASASNHWFNGREGMVAQEFVNWLSGQSWRQSLP